MKYFTLLFCILICSTTLLAQEIDDLKQKSTAPTFVVIDEFGTVDLVVNETEVTQVLEMLAIQGRRNIIASNSVTGVVSANLYDVTFNEALESILRVNGFAYVEEGNFVYVYTNDELETIEKARLKTQSRIYELQYLSAADADEFVKPLLSADGKAAFRGTVEAGYQPSMEDGGGDSYAWSSKLVINDYPDNLEAIGILLKELDTAPMQVVVEATVVQTKVDEDNEFGLDFTALSNINIGSIVGGPLAAANNLISGKFGATNATAVTSGVGQTDVTFSGGLKVGVIKDHVGAFLRVLDQVVDTTVLARPRVTCLNRQRAEVLIGTRVGYLSTKQTETSTTQSVEFLDTGIQLVFRPFISPDGMIRLELRPSVSSATLRTDGGQTVPDEITQQLMTNVRCRDGETIILGGLFRESTVITRNQVPILGDIPLIGGVFRGQDDQVEKEEIIFLLTPSIIPDERLWESGKDSLTIINSVRVGARSGLLPFSRDQITANYNRDALNAYRRGDLDRALYWTNLSLRTSKMQPEMLRLRENISDESESIWERDLLRELLNESNNAPSTVEVTR
jgi:type IV pilus secretin PilQ/predicted competence protein